MRAVTPNTVLVVGSAPQYPQGVVDDIPGHRRAFAAGAGASCHVDACMGGFVLPFAERLRPPCAALGFPRPGVTPRSRPTWASSALPPKAPSVVLYRTRPCAPAEPSSSTTGSVFLRLAWPSGHALEPQPMAAAWAVMRHLGVEGYLKLTRRRWRTPDRIRAAIAAIPGSRVLGDSCYHFVALLRRSCRRRPARRFRAPACAGEARLVSRPPGPPDSLHMTVSAPTPRRSRPRRRPQSRRRRDRGGARRPLHHLCDAGLSIIRKKWTPVLRKMTQGLWDRLAKREGACFIGAA